MASNYSANQVCAFFKQTKTRKNCKNRMKKVLCASTTLLFQFVYFCRFMLYQNKICLSLNENLPHAIILNANYSMQLSQVINDICVGTKVHIYRIVLFRII